MQRCRNIFILQHYLISKSLIVNTFRNSYLFYMNFISFKKLLYFIFIFHHLPSNNSKMDAAFKDYVYFKKIISNGKFDNYMNFDLFHMKYISFHSSCIAPSYSSIVYHNESRIHAVLGDYFHCKHYFKGKVS